MTDDSDIIYDYANDAKLQYIELVHGVSVAKILKIVDRYGLPRRGPYRQKSALSAEQLADLLERYDAGEPRDVIAALYNITPQHVRGIARDNGRPPRMRPGRQQGAHP